MTELWQAFILGAVQGITEFAPISSTAHLVLVPWLFGWDSPLLNSLTFDVALHMGTLAAILWYFFGDWVRIARAGLASIVDRRWPDDPWGRTAWLLVVATVPGALAGFTLEGFAERTFRAPWLIAGTLIIFGLLLAVAEWKGRKLKQVWDIAPPAAFLIGIGQALAIVPGVSRSGGTMAVGLFLGLEREAAARFSFMLAAPIIAGAGLKKLKDVLALNLTGGDGLVLACGFLSSLVVGYLCIKYLLRYLQNRGLYIFVWYRLVLGVIVLVAFVVRGS